MTADDYFAIQNVLFSYPFALDAGDFDAVGELLGDAVVRSGGAIMADRDAAAVAKSFRDWVLTYADGSPRTRHMLANVMIVLEGEGRAKVSSYVMVFQQADGGPLQPVIGGDYLDRLEKIDGRWRIVERTMGNDLIGDLSRHGRDFGIIQPTRANGARPLSE
ncbi:nuclear transport factor 2 family protein [Novosphingobium sp. Chol11]|jgi:hypothetical protein|uniref:nuclear transport factor 2 family protein n=1 Tax=Novosphingobium sp. Chol11 TaxID=1385763 RepID=UPI000BE2E196|nr:nuclear transport factor 2 family protein [Novosphingobium sp. Chol11]